VDQRPGGAQEHLEAATPPTQQGLTPPEARVPSPLSGPVTEPERIVSIDVLRGIAVLGILLMNIQSFAMPIAAYMNPNAYGDPTGVNGWVWYGSHFVASQKFISIFSLLFGAGVLLMTSRSEAKTGRSAGVHYRRMGWLILIGLLHAHLLWFGDILFAYGICGLFVYLVRKLRPTWLIAIAIVLLLFPIGFNLLMYGGYQIAPEEGQQQWIEGMQQSWAPTEQQVQEEVDTYQGGWLQQMPHRVITALRFETLFMAFWGFWLSSGLMLIGMALFKAKVLSASRSTGFYVAMAVLGIGLGLPFTFMQVSLLEQYNWPIIEGMTLYMNLHYAGAILQSLGYVAVIMLICKFGIAAALLRVLAAVGRMALTNYLMQTIICTLIFYGHGFGQFGAFTRVEQLYIVFGVWAAQLIWSPIWLRRFRFGPFEWLWRSLTYWKLQPMRRVSLTASTAPTA